MTKKINLVLMVFTGMFFISSCTTKPKYVNVIASFNLEKYLGKWYEVARLDFRFERNMSNVTAHYSVNDDGAIRVENKGYNYKTKVWKQAIGKAKLAGEPDEAKLKVSFFGPFYSAYNVIALDDEYKYALVVGKNLKYLWILSREPNIPSEIKDEYLKIARNMGFNTSALIWTEHNNVE